MFQHAADNGPFTLTADATQQLLGSSIGVVSLPSVYRDHPLLWASLAHETGGHDVLHADPGLLPELRNGVQRVFGGGPIGGGNGVTAGRFLGVLWAYWMDEAASDVYGVLNIGPAFGLNLAVLFAALNTILTGAPTPSLRTASGADRVGNLDSHPTDILRLDLIRGVVDSLVTLSQETRDGYARALDRLSALCGGDADSVALQGTVLTENGSGIRVNTRAPMATMKAAARTVGSFIATSRLAALGGHGTQDIETWDNPDETAAQTVMRALAAVDPAADSGDDAQLLSGATLAALAKLGTYETISIGLAAALHASWDRDPIWSTPTIDPARISTVLVDEQTYGEGVRIGWT